MKDLELTLFTEFSFDAAHFLLNYDGKCANLHGHTWKVEVWIKGSSKNLDKSGILFDFTHVKKLKDLFDHKNLNNELQNNVSCEKITLFILQELKKINPNLKYKVRVYESIYPKKSYVEAED